jgi:hypothetical protein
MDFRKSGNYRLTINRPGISEPEQLDVRYDRLELLDGDEIHYFAGPNRFYVGIPVDLIGSEFEIAPS